MAIPPHYNGLAKKFKKIYQFQKKHLVKEQFKGIGKNIFWFSLGCILGLFFFISFLYLAYEKAHEGRIFDGIMVDGVNFSGKNPQEIQNYFWRKNSSIVQKTTIILNANQLTATISAK